MIKCVIADDSALVRQVLKDILGKSSKIEVMHAAKNGEEAVKAIKENKPDIAIFDVEMPVMNGLQALKTVMKECPLPVLMFSSLTSEGASVTIKALEYGAVDFFLKPTSGSEGIKEIAQQIVKKVETIALKSRLQRLKGSPTEASVPKKSSLKNVPTKNIDLIAVGSSTGGVQATNRIFSQLPADIPPIVWVQHMPATFTEKFAERLNGICAMTVKEATHGEVIQRGVCYLAPGGIHFQLKKKGTQLIVDLNGKDKVNGFCPSCDVLFSSVGAVDCSKVLGIILTGMGNDGAQGLLGLRQKGAYVLGQNEDSCVVYGMPKAAQEAGAVDQELDVGEISEAIKKVCKL